MLNRPVIHTFFSPFSAPPALVKNRSAWYRFSTMLKDSTIPIRLDAGSKERLKAAADRLGLSTSALIRILIASFVDSYEASGGRITLPLQWPPSSPPDSPPP